MDEESAHGSATPSRPVQDDSLAELRRMVRRQAAEELRRRGDIVWQPRFAYASAAVILLTLVLMALPLWLVLYRIGDAPGEPRVRDLVALCMMLLGGFLTATAAWVIIIEMRGRVRMVDTLARTSEREVLFAAPPPAATQAGPVGGGGTAIEDLPTGDVPTVAGNGAPVDPYPNAPAVPPGTVSALPTEVSPASAAATLEASSKLLDSFGRVLKAFGQLHAQVAMLAVALALFVSAAVLSLR